MKKLRLLVAGWSAVLMSTMMVGVLQAQTFPNQPFEVVITMAPGDGLDLVGRAICAELSKVLNNQITPINKMGGGASVGISAVANAKKDGYTILFTNSNIIYTYALNPENIPYNPFQDLEPLCMTSSIPILVATLVDSPWVTFQDLLNYMDKNPGKIRGTTTGVGSSGHFALEAIRTETGRAITMIPYKGASPAIAALLGGHVEVGVYGLSVVSPHVEAGKVRLLQTSKKAPKYPGVPTLKELGYKSDTPTPWFGFYVPSGVPDSVKKILVTAMEKAVKSPDMATVHERIGALVEYKTADELKRIMQEEYLMAKELLKKGAGQE
jgi:tripartite-type tricarboxylate transporter receptor subunit TctC